MKIKMLLAVALILAGQALRLGSGQALAQDSSNVRTVGYYNTPDSAYDVTASGNFVFVADDDSGLQIINISNPAQLTLTGSCEIPGFTWRVSFSNNYAYVISSGMRIIDVSNPATPVQVGHDTSSIESIAILGNYAYMGEWDDHATGYGALSIDDISDPSNPTRVGHYHIEGGGYPAGITISDTSAYIAYNGAGFRVIDVADTSNLFQSGSCNPPQYCYSVAKVGNYAYLAVNSDYYITAGLDILDVTLPNNPVRIGHYNITNVADISVSGHYVYVATGDFGITIVDVLDPTAPMKVGYYNTPGSARGIEAYGGYIYVADYNGGLRVYEGYGPAGVNAYQIQNENLTIQNLKLRVCGNTIEYSVPQSGTASIKVYNLLGQEVNTLVRGNKTAGSYKITWNGRDDSGRRVSSGVYLVRLEANGQAVTGKMLVLR